MIMETAEAFDWRELPVLLRGDTASICALIGSFISAGIINVGKILSLPNCN